MAAAATTLPLRACLRTRSRWAMEAFRGGKGRWVEAGRLGARWLTVPSRLANRRVNGASIFTRAQPAALKRWSSSFQSAAGKGEEGGVVEGDEGTAPPTHLNPSEVAIYNKLSHSLSPSKLVVQDISGGCGSMYGIEVVSEKFRGLSVLKQQRLVNEVLGKEMIAGWHGVQIRTGVP